MSSVSLADVADQSESIFKAQRHWSRGQGPRSPLLYSHHVVTTLVLTPWKMNVMHSLIPFLFISCCFLLSQSAFFVFLRLVPFPSGSWATGCAYRWHCPVWVLCRWLAHPKYHLGEGPGTTTCTRRTSRIIQVSYLGMSFGMYNSLFVTFY